MPILNVTTEAFACIEHYAAVTGVSPDQVASEAIQTWYETTGGLELQVMTGKLKSTRKPRRGGR